MLLNEQKTRVAMIVIWILAVGMIALIFWRSKKMTQQPVVTMPVRVIPGEPSKCFDCEAQLSPSKQYLGQPSKCFSCEGQSSMPNYEHPVKVFSAETPLFTTSAYRSSAPF